MLAHQHQHQFPAMAEIQAQLENVPGYLYAVDKANDFLGDKFSTNPFEDEHGNKRRLLGPYYTDLERSTFKRIQSQAWTHDKCFLGLCGVGMDCGLGLVPLGVFFFPIAAPLATYVVHARLIGTAEHLLRLPAPLVAKLHANILFDLLLSLPPIIGALFAWLNGCLTRNAGLIYCHLAHVAADREAGPNPEYVGVVGQQDPGNGTAAPTYVGTVGALAPTYVGTVEAAPEKKAPVKKAPQSLKRKEKDTAPDIQVGTQTLGMR